VGIQAVPHHHERAAELLVRGVQQAGVVGLGEALALVVPASAVGAVDQPGAAAGPGGDQRGQRHARVAAAGDRHDRGMAAAAPGASFRRPEALARFVFED